MCVLNIWRKELFKRMNAKQMMSSDEQKVSIAFDNMEIKSEVGLKN